MLCCHLQVALESVLFGQSKPYAFLPPAQGDLDLSLFLPLLFFLLKLRSSDFSAIRTGYGFDWVKYWNILWFGSRQDKCFGLPSPRNLKKGPGFTKYVVAC